jgi:putative oxidoreductase
MNRALDRLQPFGLLLLRLAIGAVFVAHGYPKVFGGLQQFGQSVAGFGFPAWLGYVAAFTEFVGGLLLIFGILTRYAAFGLVCMMVVAVWKVHWKNGFIGQGNYQFPLVLGAAALVFVFFGGGRFALDRWLLRPSLPPRAKTRP